MQLSQQLLYFKWTGNGTKFCDVAKCMSLVNRKLHRQQGLWTIGGFKYHTDGAGAEIQIAHAPKIWPVRNSLVMGYKAWAKQQQRAYKAGAKSLKPKWQDFMVYLNRAHAEGGTELVPRSGGPYDNGTTATVVSSAASNWVHSQLVFNELDSAAGAGGDEVSLEQPYLHILGDDNGLTNVGLVKHYALSRASIDHDASGEPEHDASAQLSIFTRSSEPVDEAIEEIVEHLTDHNDQPPYDPDNYPGGASHFNEPVVGAFAQVSAGDVGRSISMNGLSAPNGLLEIRAKEPSGSATHHLLVYVVGREAY